MPTVNDPSPPPLHRRHSPRPIGDCAVPLFCWRGTEFSLSCGVFIAAAALAVAVGVATGREGNGDLTLVAGLGVLIWGAGWGVQVFAALIFASLFGLRLRTLTIGVIGLSVRPHHWKPGRSLAWSLSTMGSLLAIALAVWAIAQSRPSALAAGLPAGPWSVIAAPALGLSPADAPWHAAAWLLAFQVACQAVPVPSTLGRMSLLSSVSFGFREFPQDLRRDFARRTIRAIACVVALVALGMIPADAQAVPLRWPIVLLLAAALWVSARSKDVSELSELSELRRDDPDSPTPFTDQRPPLPERLRESLRARQEQQRLAEAVRREHEEALDAARLDEILDRLHRGGLESLPPADRQVLDRVSRTLRDLRAAELDAD